MSRLSLENTLLDDRYEIGRCLGQGSYAEIFLASDRREAMPVVVKALNVHLQGTPDAALERTLIENFENEALVLDAVRHPNVVRRLGHGTGTDLNGRMFHYLVFEYMSGGNLLEYCRARGALTLDETLHYFQQVVEALAHAHDAHIVHRDLKPSNLLLSQDFRTIKIADFGVAKRGAHQADDEITRVGTSVYAPPEHHPDFDPAISAGVRLTEAADIYALAKTLYTVMSGQAPLAFSGRPITKLPPALAHLPYADALLSIFNKATANEASDRYEDVESFWSDFSKLEDMQADETTHVRTRSARSAPLDIPAAPPLPSFVPAAGPPGRIVIALDPPQRSEVVPPPPSIPDVPPTTVMPVVAPLDVPPTEVTPRPARVGGGPGATLLGVAVMVVLVVGFAGVMVVLYHVVKSSVSGPTASAPREPGLFRATARQGVNVRATRSVTGDNIVGELGEGVRVEVLEIQGNWYRVRPDSWVRQRDSGVSEGWADGRFFKREE